MWRGFPAHYPHEVSVAFPQVSLVEFAWEGRDLNPGLSEQAAFGPHHISGCSVHNALGKKVDKEECMSDISFLSTLSVCFVHSTDSRMGEGIFSTAVHSPSVLLPAYFFCWEPHKSGRGWLWVLPTTIQYKGGVNPLPLKKKHSRVFLLLMAQMMLLEKTADKVLFRLPRQLWQ